MALSIEARTCLTCTLLAIQRAAKRCMDNTCCLTLSSVSFGNATSSGSSSRCKSFESWTNGANHSNVGGPPGLEAFHAFSTPPHLV